MFWIWILHWYLGVVKRSKGFLTWIINVGKIKIKKIVREFNLSVLGNSKEDYIYSKYTLKILINENRIVLQILNACFKYTQ